MVNSDEPARNRPPKTVKSTAGRDRLLLLLLLSLTSLPFLNQAFHIDDRIYLKVADNTLSKPLFPYDYVPVFEGMGADDAASHSHLPLTSYYLAAIKWVTGSSQEWVFHLAFLVFPVICVIAFYDLAGRFVEERFWATCLLICSPVFVVLSHTLMTDVPTLAFWLLSLSRFFRITEGEGRGRDWVVLFVATLCAAFITLLSAGLVVLMAAHLWLQAGRRMRKVAVRRWLPLLGPPFVLWVVWYLRAYIHYDRFVLLNTWAHVSSREGFDGSLLGQKLLSFLLNMGGLFLFPLALWIVFSGRFQTRLAMLLGYLSLVPLFIWFTEWGWPEMLLLALLLPSGALAFGHCLSCLRDPRAERKILGLWTAGICLTALVLFYSGSARYVLPALPPCLLVWVARLEDKSWNLYFRRNLFRVIAGVTLLCSAALSLADYEFAGSYRTFASQVRADYIESGRKVWFAGEWGFRYYMEKEGATLLSRVELGPSPGDLIIKPVVAMPWVTIYDGRPFTRLLKQQEAGPLSVPVRILDFSSRAGFYSTGWGILPFSFSTGGRWEWFNVYEVVQPFSGELPPVPRHW